MRFVHLNVKETTIMIRSLLVKKTINDFSVEAPFFQVKNNNYENMDLEFRIA